MAQPQPQQAAVTIPGPYPSAQHQLQNQEQNQQQIPQQIQPQNQQQIQQQAQHQFAPPQPAQPVHSPTPQYQAQQHYQQQSNGPPPPKRPRIDGPSAPASPYQHHSPYPMSPASQSPVASPHPQTSNLHNATNGFANSPTQANGYSTPYATPHAMNGNGNSTPSYSLQPPVQPSQYSAQPQTGFQQPQSNHQHPNQNYTATQNGAGTMGPPSKPVEKSREEGVDPMDVLGGTGINLLEEEQYQFSKFNTSFNSQQSGSQSGSINSGHSFTQFPPGSEGSFYGAGPANAAPEPNLHESQEAHQIAAAKKAWTDAAADLAVSRERELNNPFLEIRQLHMKTAKIARENGLQLRTDAQGTMGRMKLPEQFPNVGARVHTAVGPDGILTTTSGEFLPFDSLLVDQLALLSIATKQRLRVMIGDASRLAKGRREGTDGVVPEEWVDSAVPISLGNASVVQGTLRSGFESAVSPHSHAVKAPTLPAGSIKNMKSQVAIIHRAEAKKEREFEEERIRNRLARQAKAAAAADGTPRQGSIVPGTPGSVAPDPVEKAPSKKEQRKKAEAKISEVASHAAANITTSQFLKSGGGVFGKKKGGYSWMTSAGATGGSSTPGRVRTQNQASGASGPPQKVQHTQEGARRLGTHRENQDKGKGIQIRDWMAVLEDDGREKRALQKIYATLKEY